jgi:hypothetical protein
MSAPPNRPGALIDAMSNDEESGIDRRKGECYQEGYLGEHGKSVALNTFTTATTT